MSDQSPLRRHPVMAGFAGGLIVGLVMMAGVLAVVQGDDPDAEPPAAAPAEPGEPDEPDRVPEDDTNDQPEAVPPTTEEPPATDDEVEPIPEEEEAEPEREWPGPETTGVVDEDALESSDSVSTSEDGEVIENLEITGRIEVKHEDVVIRNVRIIGAGRYGISVPTDLRDEASFTVEDTEIGGESGDRSAGIAPYGTWTARRVNIHGYEDGVKVGSDHVLEDSWIHDLYQPSGAHADGLQSVGGSDVVIRGNNFDTPDSNAAIIVQTHLRPVDDYTIENNRFVGGNYTVYLIDNDDGHGDPTNLIVQDNVWVEDTWVYGPVSLDLGDGSTWENNVTENGERVG